MDTLNRKNHSNEKKPEGTIDMEYFTLFLSLSAFSFSIYFFFISKIDNIRPILVFSRQGEGCWMLENVGKGPALNLIVADCDRFGIPYRVLCYPLSTESTKELLWIQHGHSLSAIYSDYENHFYLSKIDDNIAITKNERKIKKLGQFDTTEFLALLESKINKNEVLAGQNLTNLSQAELRIKRNEIFARHGYIFEDEDLKSFFSKMEWYSPSISNQGDVYRLQFSDKERFLVEYILCLEKKLRPVRNSQVRRVVR